MDPKPNNWFQSPPPTRVSTPLPQQNPYIDSLDAVHLGYRSRIRPNRVQALDPEDFLLGNFEESPESHTKSFSKKKEHEFENVEFHYPTDEAGEEMSEVARVWRIYIDEATKFDSSLAEGWNRGIDVLLVFVRRP